MDNRILQDGDHSRKGGFSFQGSMTCTWYGAMVPELDTMLMITQPPAGEGSTGECAFRFPTRSA
jgi:hypothetical protein